MTASPPTPSGWRSGRSATSSWTTICARPASSPLRAPTRRTSSATWSPHAASDAVPPGRRRRLGDARGAASLTPQLDVAQPQRQRRARPHGAQCVLAQLRRDLVVEDDRIAPVVELDPLGEELGAQAVPVAGDRVKLDPLAHAATPTAVRAQAEHAPRHTWSSSSSAKTRVALESRRATPSGCAQAP